jgi:hypothetical protein
MEKYCLFHIEGGLGKNVAATAVAKCIKNNYQDRKLIVVASYPEVFLTLPFVDRVFRIGITPYFYQDYILNNDTLIFKHEPYFTTDHIYKRKHLIENWCNIYNLTYNNETPELVFNLRHKQLAIRDWRRNKPIMILQTNGGPINEQPYNYSWTRDMPFSTSQAIVNAFKNDYHIIQICRNENNVIEGTEPLFKPMTNMELFSLLMASEKRVLIDSSLQHAAAAMGLPSVVLWVGTSPTVFGYGLHKNIISNLPEIKLPDSYLFDYSFNGSTQECPFIDDNIFNPEIVIQTILQ